LKKYILTIILIFQLIIINAQCWKSIEAGQQTSMALSSDGTLWVWGNNWWGQVGDGTNINRNTPVQIGASNEWKLADAGFTFHLAIKADGSLWAWGFNSSGQFGIGFTSLQNTPLQSGTDTNWSQIAAGSSHSLAIKTDGSLWGCGYNQFGQVGVGSTVDQMFFTSLSVSSNWTSVAAYGNSSFAINSDGELWAWGQNSYGELGNGVIGQLYVPTKIGTDTNWVQVAAGDSHTLAIKSDGTLWAWGANDYGALGDNTSIPKLTPTQIGLDTNWTYVSAGDRYSLGLKSDGSLWCWGFNTHGQLGDGTNVAKYIPTQIGSANNWELPECGDYNSIVARRDGTIWTTGYNVSGALGDSTFIDKNTFAAINAGYNSQVNINICSSLLPYTWHGQSYLNGGTFTFVTTNSNGCDSIETLNLMIDYSDTTISNVSICPLQLPYIWNGQSITSAGTYTHSTINTSGCDSTQILNFNVTPIVYSNSNLVVCPLQLPYNWNGQVLSSSGLYTFSTINANGCDSVSSINLIVDSILNTNLNVSVCANQLPYLWNGQNLNSTGVYSFTTTNFYGCDSSSTLNFFIKSIDYDSTNISICMNQLPYNWNGQSFSNAGVYTQSLVNSVGCDSILTLDLSIINFNATISQLGNSMWSNAVGADYQWINCNTNSIIWGATNQGYTTVTSGDYAVISTIFGCTDTSDCIRIYSVNTPEVLISNEIKIFPNPSSGVFNFFSNINLEDAILEVTNYLGETIFKKTKLSGNTFKFDLSSFANGVYIVELIEKNKSIRTKILKG
jgi:alpha-tubulin suppressor-like RCC1 family protein